jgi:UDP-N-acetylglucosamine 2-epimerase (non-hydrolysing)
VLQGTFDVDVSVVIGTRPELIKLAPVVRALLQVDHQTRVVLSGQHRELATQLLPDLEIVPDVDLAVMRRGQSLNELCGRLFNALDGELSAHHPRRLIVQGDTTTAMVTTLAAFHAGIPVGHVEAGLRSHRLNNPFPEEANRQLVARLARWHFAPTHAAASNLVLEGIPDHSIWVTGNTVIDNLEWVRGRGLGRSQFPVASGRRKVLLTLHRRESQGRVMLALARTLGELAHKLELDVVVPVHPSPAVRSSLLPEFERHPNVIVRPPLDYLDFVATMADCHFVITDSGGVQEEAPWLGKPVLVCRETTERAEAIEEGVARLIGTRPRDLRTWVTALCQDPTLYATMSRRVSPYGDGRAAERIAEVLFASDRLQVPYEAASSREGHPWKKGSAVITDGSAWTSAHNITTEDWDLNGSTAAIS